MKNNTLQFIKVLKNFVIILLILGRGKSCKSIKDTDPNAVSGIYEVEIQGEIIKLFCQMTVTGGGWAVSFYKVFVYFFNFKN